MSKRRDAVFALAAGLLTAPSAAAQRANRPPRIALVFNATPVAEMAGTEPASRHARAFMHGLRDLGYVEGRNIVVVRRSAEGRLDHLPALMTEVVALGADVIVAIGPGAVAAQRATDSIPIIALVDDPEPGGLAASLGRPGRNVTGITGTAGPAIHGKLLQLLVEAAPGSTRVGVFDYKYVDRQTTPGTHLRRREHETAAGVLGVKLVGVGIDAAGDYGPAFEQIIAQRADALLVEGIPLIVANPQPIVDFAAKQRLPALYSWRGAVDAGGLMSYGSNDVAQFRRAAVYVKKILEGVKPADLPFEQPTTFELVINLRTARAVGLVIPRSLLLRADEVIE
jgi:putative ABC transport system substrate-binding protein